MGHEGSDIIISINISCPPKTLLLRQSSRFALGSTVQSLPIQIENIYSCITSGCNVSLTKWLGYRLFLEKKKRKGGLDDGAEETRMTGKRNGEIEKVEDKGKRMGG